MDLQKDNIRKIYFKYLCPSLFSGLVMSIYSLVDMIKATPQGVFAKERMRIFAGVWGVPNKHSEHAVRRAMRD